MNKHLFTKPGNKRFTALDLFRGMTICVMIVVNTPGNEETSFSFLKHADWHGFTLADLVFPSFLFAVGNALSFSCKRWVSQTTSEVMLKIGKRTLLIFLVGYLMYWFPFFSLDDNAHIVFSPFSHTRIMGVLQRIALCYGITAVMVYYLSKGRTHFVSMSFLILYWAILVWFGNPGLEYSKTGNAVLSVDTFLFGTNHLYQGEGFPFDPEGVLSTLPAIFNVICGYIAGSFIQSKRPRKKKLIQLAIIGTGMLIIAYAWSRYLPINKKLWTSSYAVLTVGLDYLVMAAILYWTDFLKIKRGNKFFLIFGKNPLAIYVLSEIGVTLMWLIPVGDTPLYSFIYNAVFVHAGGNIGSLLFALWWMLMCWIVAYLLDRKKIYIKL
jgi:predicted acyltransferase